MLSQPEFDPLTLGKYSVIKVHFEFPPEPPDLKRFIVLRHVNAPQPYCKCLKATTRTELYEANPERLASCVMYNADELPFFSKKTAIQPDNAFNIAHAHFVRYAKINKCWHIGKMPEDFHGKLVHAIKKSCLLSVKQMNDLLTAIGENAV